ncbi:beta-propeller domain-containing protein [Aliiglaciecola sp. 2_MG-2023]|uniref:beta-propeller domain-containing protein n=1 Tax=unclassified Aliiglaciecola TaxID=2593648 RepID=UPI0026E24CD2|nr:MULTISPECIES: beta-propeller domain-containing protein [unclassified Aliiglaciecola]MDO6712017.1 beta-propeller domain-containing protein [Aliiglaciecola sp. 2_MG-2023]MDO6753619.1 beta-propeller domain-containing protein [Aliiglaciecola sp. 1_MG-2023]
MYGNKAAMSSLFAALLLGACGGGSGTDTKVTENKPPEVNQPSGFVGALVQDSGKTERYIKNGIYAASLSESDYTAGGDVASPSIGSSPYSTTNTVESGVDEADRIKYDGETFYLANYPIWSSANQSPADIRVIQRNQDDTLTSLPNIPLAQESDDIIGIYLHQKRLVAISSTMPVYPIDFISIAPWEPVEQKFSVQFFNVSDPHNALAENLLTFDGSLLSTRRIDNQLYVASSYVPYIDGLQPYAATDEEKLANYQNVIGVSSDAVMPRVDINGQSMAMNLMAECYVPEAATEDDGFAQILTVTRINIDDPTDQQSICMSVQAYMLYMSEQSMYLASSIEGQQTAFHKISLENMSYQASGAVDGVLSWRSDPLFKVDESDGYLRVITTDNSVSPAVHQLTVLAQSGNELTTIASLPNENQPQAIGKPGEDIYAVRFIDEQAYIVTFERIDPLYIIDLSDNSAPFIAGSLEIPGFSSYLHPLKNGLLLGVGQQVQLDDLPSNGDATLVENSAQVMLSPPPVEPNGMKVSLFDIRDAANPIELTSIIAADAFTPVEFNYKALSVLEADGFYRFAFPVEKLKSSTDVSSNDNVVDVPQNSLMLFSVETKDVSPELEWLGNVKADNDSAEYIFSGEDRSVIQGEYVYYFRGNQVWQALWANPSAVSGPF